MGEDLPLQAPVFFVLTQLIEVRCGLKFGEADRERLAGAMSPRARELGLESLLDYYRFLRYDPKGREELDQLLEALMIHETYFFREDQQLQLLVDTFLAPMVEEGGRPRVWCAAAASGEEAYTLGMLLGERALLGKVELLASDLSRPMLAHARQGLYEGRSLRAVGGTVAYRWLDREGPKVRVIAALRAAIEWRRINLVELAEVEALGQFDAILCRNVLIYFGDQTTVQIVEQLGALLRPGGLLLVGASESLALLGTSLASIERSGAFYYRKSA